MSTMRRRPQALTPPANPDTAIRPIQQGRQPSAAQRKEVSDSIFCCCQLQRFERRVRVTQRVDQLTLLPKPQ
eukprot:2196974-Amphidinium_carterae.1